MSTVCRSQGAFSDGHLDLELFCYREPLLRCDADSKLPEIALYSLAGSAATASGSCRKRPATKSRSRWELVQKGLEQSSKARRPATDTV